MRAICYCRSISIIFSTSVKCFFDIFMSEKLQFLKTLRIYGGLCVSSLIEIYVETDKHADMIISAQLFILTWIGLSLILLIITYFDPKFLYNFMSNIQEYYQENVIHDQNKWAYQENGTTIHIFSSRFSCSLHSETYIHCLTIYRTNFWCNG